MKNLLLSMFAMLLFAGTASAQGNIFGPRSDYYYNGEEFYRTKFGFEAGLNMSNTLMGSNANFNFNTGSLTGFNAGVMVEIPVAYPFSIQPEVMFSQKGFDAVTVNGNFTQRTQFLDVPILGKFVLNRAVNFYIGPQISYMAGLRNSFHNGFNAGNESYYDNVSNKLYYAGVIGASLNVTQHVELRARYTVDLQQNYSNGNDYMPNYSNQVVQFGFGYKF